MTNLHYLRKKDDEKIREEHTSDKNYSFEVSRACRRLYMCELLEDALMVAESLASDDMKRNVVPALIIANSMPEEVIVG